MPCPRLAASLIGLAGIALALAATAQAQTPPAPPSSGHSEPALPSAGVPAPLIPGDAFGEEVTLPARTIVYVLGYTKLDDAFDKLSASFKTLHQFLDKQAVTPDGPAMTIYIKTDDFGFDYHAALPVAQSPNAPLPDGISVGAAPAGNALKFVHRGSYESIDSTYEAIINHLDQKQLDAEDQFVEEYVTEILKTSPDNLVINIYVPVKQP